MTPARLKEIKARCEAATEGPWFDAGNKIGADGHGIAEVEFDEQADMDLCVNARQDLPDCVKEIERLKQELALEKANAEMRRKEIGLGVDENERLQKDLKTSGENFQAMCDEVNRLRGT